MTIQSQVSILSIDSISSSRSELSSDIYLSHEWQDNRCKWNTSGTGNWNKIILLFLNKPKYFMGR